MYAVAVYCMPRVLSWQRASRSKKIDKRLWPAERAIEFSRQMARAIKY